MCLGAVELSGGGDLRARARAGGGVQVQYAEEPVLGVRRQLLPLRHDTLGVGPGPRERVGGDIGDGMRSEDESRDDAEVATAPSAQRPGQVCVLVRVRDNGSAVREDDGRLEQVVAGQAELARQEADAAAERKPGDPDRRTRAGRNSTRCSSSCQAAS